MTTPLSHIVLGTVVYTKGIRFDRDDLSLNADSRSRSSAASGKNKHFGIIIGKDATGIIVAGTTTLGGATQLIGTVREVSLPYWIPVKPATKEPGMTHEPVARASGDEAAMRLRNLWISIRWSNYIPGEEFTISAVETYSLATVNVIRAALGIPSVV